MAILSQWYIIFFHKAFLGGIRLFIVMGVVSAVLCGYVARYYLHMLQLESYQLDGYIRWLEKNRDRHLGLTLYVGVGAFVAFELLFLILRAAAGEYTSLIISGCLTAAAFTAGALFCDKKHHSQAAKKPIAYTARMKRLYACLGVLCLLISLVFVLLRLPAYLLLAAIPYLPLAAGYLMTPVENAINRRYLNEAKSILASRPDLIKIGITGSYGKTSTKFILAGILSEKYDVLATPASFNTPMGLTRVIRERLEGHHQVFIAEMGARHVGDIKELVELVHPGYGVITTVGPQHLETFGNIETVANTKFELIEGLPEDGVAFFASDGGEVDKLYRRTTVKKYLTGREGTKADMTAGNINVTSEGSVFTLCDQASGESITVRTKLLGRHNIDNITLACCVARALGMSMDEIARGVARLEPVEHRLQLLPGTNGMTVIDDAFNSNPSGAKGALDVLSAFSGRHVIITPGMVEQGEKEAEINRIFGGQMASVCDEVILVGKRHTQPIADGLKAAGMDMTHVYVTGSLEEATAVLGRIGMQGDVVLFENDLPDSYNET